MTTNNTKQIAASVLAADFGQLHAQIQEAVEAGINWFHIDIMDGSYVPQISFGTNMIKLVKQATDDCHIDVHMMVEKPENHIPAAIDAGADLISFHPEATYRVHHCLDTIHSGGAQAGLALSPGTALEVAVPELTELDLLLIMTVEPGFGGQKMIASMLPKVAKARQLIDTTDASIRLQVDGGVTSNNIGQLAEAGADTFVTGSSLFGSNIKLSLDGLVNNLTSDG